VLAGLTASCERQPSVQTQESRSRDQPQEPQFPPMKREICSPHRDVTTTGKGTAFSSPQTTGVAVGFNMWQAFLCHSELL
jgi:hypothetical protein